MSAPANPFAFPSPDDGRPSDGYGMELRDWFAGQALSTVAAYQQEDVATWSYKDFADHAYGIADAMLREREKGGAQ